MPLKQLALIFLILLLLGYLGSKALSPKVTPEISQQDEVTVKEMAQFLETAPPETLQALMGETVENSELPSIPQKNYETISQQLWETEKKIFSHYSGAKNEEKLRKLITLELHGHDPKPGIGLQRSEIIRELTQEDPLSIVTDIDLVLGNLGEEDEYERQVLIGHLKTFARSNQVSGEQARQILTKEVSRPIVEAIETTDSNEEKLDFRTTKKIDIILETYYALKQNHEDFQKFLRKSAELQKNNPRIENYLKTMMPNSKATSTTDSNQTNEQDSQ